MRRFGAALSIGALIWLVAASAAFAGNNGTLKIHEDGTPTGTENNDPKVCTLNVEGFGLDPFQTGYLSFDVQGGDAPSEYFTPPAGHYMVTLYGKADLTDVKAKSKVFKVTCEGGSWPGGTT
jgi:hypothetical protein